MKGPSETCGKKQQNERIVKVDHRWRSARLEQVSEYVWWRVAGWMCSLSQRIIQELVTPQVAFQPSDIQTVRVVQSVDAGQLNGEADFVPLILLGVAVDRLASETRRSVDGRRSGSHSSLCSVFRLRMCQRRHLRRLTAHEQAPQHTTSRRAERRMRLRR